MQRFCQEGVAWKHLRHPNVLPLLGVTVYEHQFALVYEYMGNRNINEFIQKNKYVNRTELVRCPLLPTRIGATDVLLSWLMLRTAWRTCMASIWFMAISKGYVFFPYITSAHLALICEGEHPHQWGPKSLSRRLRALYHHQCCNPRHRRGFSDVVDLKRHIHIIYRWGGLSVDES